MDSMMEKIRAWNIEMKDTPRKLLLCLCVLLCAVLVWVVLPYCWPFAAALLFSLLMQPLVKRLRRVMVKWKGGRAVATLIGMIVVFGVIGGAGWFLMRRVVSELITMGKAAPGVISQVYTAVTELIAQYSGSIDPDIAALLDTAISEVSKALMSAATTLSGVLASGAISTATSLPTVILSVVLCIMGTFYLSYDKERILSFFKKILPESVTNAVKRLKKGIVKAVFGQLKSQVLVSALITVTVIAGLLIQQQPYALVIGLLIGVADALPVVGAGLFLIPWSLIGFVLGDTATGIGMAVLYVATIVVRQISEPRIVGANLGLYPLATMMSMFAGLTLIGFWGILAGPVLLNVCRVVLDADRERHTPLPSARPTPDVPNLPPRDKKEET